MDVGYLLAWKETNILDLGLLEAKASIGHYITRTLIKLNKLVDEAINFYAFTMIISASVDVRTLLPYKGTCPYYVVLTMYTLCYEQGHRLIQMLSRRLRL